MVTIASQGPYCPLWSGRILTEAQEAAERFRPGPGIMHRALIGLLGMPICELCNLDPLAAARTVGRQWSFLLTAAPLSIADGAADLPAARVRAGHEPGQGHLTSIAPHRAMDLRPPDGGDTRLLIWRRRGYGVTTSSGLIHEYERAE